MIRGARALALLLLLATTKTASSADPADAYDLLIHGADGPPVNLRLRVEVGGQSLAARFLRLDATPATQPYGELLTRALVAALDRDRNGKLTKEELRAAERVLLERFDADEDECITPFELVPSLLTDAPRKARVAPKLTLSHPGQAHDTKPDREITVRLDERQRGRVLIRARDWILDVGTQTASPNSADRRAGGVSPLILPIGENQGAYAPRSPNLVALTISPQPRSWFAILDADGDGQLSVRELRAAWERLADAEADKAGFVKAPDEDGHYLTLTFVRGVGGARGIPLTKRPTLGRGPAWFQAMDRNGDGSISPREFLGTREQFRRLDRDGDGLLSPEEAGALR